VRSRPPQPACTAWPASKSHSQSSIAMGSRSRTWPAFTAITGLSLYGREVVVVGFGPVGQGVALRARDLGANVTVVDLAWIHRSTVGRGSRRVFELNGSAEWSAGGGGTRCMSMLGMLVCQRVVLVCGCAGPLRRCQVTSGRDRIRSRATLNVVDQGQRAGRR